MSKFLYYVPGNVTLNREPMLNDIGFPFADVAGCPGAICNKGPDGNAGSIFSLVGNFSGKATDAKIGYYPDQQTWQLVGKWWVGFMTDSKPTPDDLLIKDLYDGYMVKMLDGNQWFVPIARQLTGEVALNNKYAMDAEGNRIRTVADEHKRLWELTKIVWKWFADPDAERLDYDIAFEAASLALAINYRVTEKEILALELFSDDQVRDCVNALVNEPLLNLLTDASKKDQKKTA